MAQPHTAADCIRTGASPDKASGCPVTHKAADSATSNAWIDGSGQTSVTIIDHSWGVPGLGTDGTLALGGMAIAAATVTIVAWRALTPAKLVRR
jgi:hypothetical protein